MKKKIVIFGGSLFEGIRFVNGTYQVFATKSLSELMQCCAIDNYSNQEMTSKLAYELIEKLKVKDNYDDCILALGERELDHLDEFVQNMEKIIAYLQKHHIRILLVSLPKEQMTSPNAYCLQQQLDQLAWTYNIDYLYDGVTDQCVSYQFSNDSELKHAILELC